MGDEIKLNVGRDNAQSQVNLPGQNEAGRMGATSVTQQSSTDPKYKITSNIALSDLSPSSILHLKAKEAMLHVNVRVRDLARFLGETPEKIISLMRENKEDELSSSIESHGNLSNIVSEEKFQSNIQHLNPAQQSIVLSHFARLKEAGADQIPVIPRESVERHSIPGGNRTIHKEEKLKKSSSAFTTKTGHHVVVLKDFKLGWGAMKDLFASIENFEIAATAKSVFKPDPDDYYETQIENSEMFTEAGQREIDIGKALKDKPGLVSMKHGFCYFSNTKEIFSGVPIPKFMVTMEFMNGGDVMGYLQKGNPLRTPENDYNIMLGVAHGLVSLDEADVNHRDLKFENVFLTIKDGKVEAAKIGDYGLARFRKDEENSLEFGGSLLYVAKEYVKGFIIKGGDEITPAQARTTLAELQRMYDENLQEYGTLLLDNGANLEVEIKKQKDEIEKQNVELVNIIETFTLDQELMATIKEGKLTRADLQEFQEELEQSKEKFQAAGTYRIFQQLLRTIVSNSNFPNPLPMSNDEKNQSNQECWNKLEQCAKMTLEVETKQKNLGLNKEALALNQERFDRLNRNVQQMKHIQQDMDYYNTIIGRVHPKRDMWAAGIMLYQLRNGYNPSFLNATDEFQLLTNIQGLTQQKVRKKNFSETIEPGSLEELNLRLLSVNPDERPTPQEFLAAMQKFTSKDFEKKK